MTSSVTPSHPADLSHNKLLPSDRAFHDWYRFVLSYPPHLVRHYIDQFGLEKGATLLDPFCGTGTTIVEAKKNGLASVGVEAIPMSHFACSTKVQWQVDLDQLNLAKDQVLAQVSQREAAAVLTFTPEQTAIVLKNSISAVPLHKCLVLQEAIAAVTMPLVRSILQLALAYVAVHGASNLKFGPEVGIRRRKRDDAPVIEQWQAKVEQMAADLAAYQDLATVPARCHHGDARSLRSLLAPNSIDAIITSPPYPNEKDYTRTTRLESVLLGFLKDKVDLRRFKQSLIRSNTRNVYKVDDDDRVLTSQSQITALAQAIEDRRLALNKTSGFERLYHRVTTLYFGGMKRHLQELQLALKPGAQLAYVVGDQASFFQIMIRTGELLEEIAAEVGYRVKDRDLFRTRLSTATGAQLREEVVVLEWSGTAQSPSHFVR
ncbi:MAG: DNA methyltransferase [Cyanobacteria bacterium P01_A01_bin.70]